MLVESVFIYASQVSDMKRSVFDGARGTACRSSPEGRTNTRELWGQMKLWWTELKSESIKVVEWIINAEEKGVGLEDHGWHNSKSNGGFEFSKNVLTERSTEGKWESGVRLSLDLFSLSLESHNNNYMVRLYLWILKHSGVKMILCFSFKIFVSKVPTANCFVGVVYWCCPKYLHNLS